MTRPQPKDEAFARLLLFCWNAFLGYSLARCSWIIFRDTVAGHFQDGGWLGDRFPYFMAFQVLGWYAVKFFTRSLDAFAREGQPWPGA
ncbi:MAG: hypothetical protein V4498_02585 [candidate division FCPU426 bacterium]